MKLGEVLKKERENRDLPVATVAQRLGIEIEEYRAMESGEHAQLEALGGMLLGFNELIEGQVNQIFYPCGLPFSEVRDYGVS